MGGIEEGREGVMRVERKWQWGRGKLEVGEGSEMFDFPPFEEYLRMTRDGGKEKSKKSGEEMARGEGGGGKE